MDTLKAMYSRKSVRSFTEEALTKEEIDTLLTAAGAAPVGMGKYDLMHLTVITDKELLNEIDANGAKFFGNPDLHPLYAPAALIIVSASSEMSAEMGNANTGAIVQNMTLAAIELGLGSVYIWGCMAGLRANPELLAKVNLPEGHTIYGSIAVGHPTEPQTERAVSADKIAVSYI